MNQPNASDLDQEKLKDMAWLLNDLTSDLKTPVNLIFRLDPAIIDGKDNFMAISRLCLHSLIINLCKLKEIIDHYGYEIRGFPDDLRKPLYELKRKIESKGMYAFRSKYLAHAFSKDENGEKKPLSFDENIKALMKVIDYGRSPAKENVFEFCGWVFTQGKEHTVVYIVAKTVKHIDHIVGGLGRRR